MHIICIEGLDGVGKESIANQLVDVIEMHGFFVERVSFPDYRSHTGTVIRNLLSGQYGDASKMSPYLVAPLYTLDRISYFKDNLDRLRKLDFVILDRSYYSNFMYQASKLWYSIEPTSILEENRIDALSEWCKINYALELKDTGLAEAAASISVIYLQLSEQDRQRQIKKRESLDTNELNLEYLELCRMFMSISTIGKIAANPKGREEYMQAYVGDSLYRVNVQHAERYEDIENENRATAKNIFYKLIDDIYSIQDVRLIEYRTDISLDKIRNRLKFELNLENVEDIKLPLQFHVRKTNNGLEIIIVTVIKNCSNPGEVADDIEVKLEHIMESELANLKVVLDPDCEVIFKAVVI